MKVLFILGILLSGCESPPPERERQGASDEQNTLTSDEQNTLTNEDTQKLYYICDSFISDVECRKEVLDLSSKKDKINHLVYCISKSDTKVGFLSNKYQISSVEDYLLTFDPDTFKAAINQGNKWTRERDDYMRERGLKGGTKYAEQWSSEDVDHITELSIKSSEGFIEVLDCYSEFDFK